MRRSSGAGRHVGRSLVGARIRELRKARGLTQAGLAASVGISASYLNLIEADRRRIGGALLRRLGDELGVPSEELDGAAERRLVADLEEVAGEAALAPLRLDPDAAAELAGRHPAWARAIVSLHRSWHDRGRVVTALSDRLNQDPFLGDAVHSMLSRVAAIRSSAEILDGADDLPSEQRARFVAIVREESVLLGDVSQALAAYFDKAHVATRSITPVEELDDFIYDNDNHFPLLEQTARDFRAAARISDAWDDGLLVDYLRDVHSVHVRMVPAGSGGAVVGSTANAVRRGAFFDQSTRVFSIADWTAPATRRFELARLASGLFHQGRAVSEVVDASAALTSEAARRRARDALSAYLAAAVLMPYEAFLDAAQSVRYDIDLLGRRFGASFEQVCHRLVSLRRPDAPGIPFALMRTGPSGHVSKRMPLPHLPLPRHGSACPLWAVHAAYQAPGTVIRQLAEFPSGERFLFLARTVEKGRASFASPRRLLSIMLACEALHADRTVYAEGLDVSSTAPATPVGPNCRICVRRGCLHREEDAIINA